MGAMRKRTCTGMARVASTSRGSVSSLVFLLLHAQRSAGRACNPLIYEPAIEAAVNSSTGNSSARAAAIAFMDACDPNGHWTSYDVKKYFQNIWHAGEPAGASCSNLRRVGLHGDGGKGVCEIDKLLSRKPCHVVSIGSNGEPSFEKAIHALGPHCRIDTHDGTLVGDRIKLRDNLPSYVDFYPENVSNETWKLYTNGTSRGRVSLLKMDCEGCEFDSLPPLVQNVCIDQILLELHGCSRRYDAKHRVLRVHELMLRLDEDYLIFYVEPNLAYSDGTCIEYSFRRRTPCAGVSFGRLEANWRAGGHGASIHVGTHRKGVHHRQWRLAKKSQRKSSARDV